MMKAVDFACIFVVNLGRVNLSPIEVKILLGIAAGRENAVDIAELLDIRLCSCTLALKNMEKRGLLRRQGGSTYGLADAGGAMLKRLFAPNPHTP